MRFLSAGQAATVDRIGAGTVLHLESLMTTELLIPPASLPRPVTLLPGLVPGLLLTAVLAIAAMELGKLTLFAEHGMSALTLAILLGIVLGNSFTPRVAVVSASGVQFSKQNLLRLGIILYGVRLTMQQIGEVGVAGVVIDALVLCSTFGLALFLGIKVFRLERDTAILIGAGSSICGAAAVLATEPVLQARSEQVTVAVSTVVVFGTLAIFIYPLLFQLNLHWQVLDTTPASFGIYIGSTLHEVAQVVAAARSIGDEAANTAVIAKMVRVMMLAPFLIGLSAYIARSRRTACADAGSTTGRLAVPWFAFIFIAVVALNSVVQLPRALVTVLIDIDTFLLAMAMAALGLGTRLSAIRQAGARPLLLAALLFLWLVGGGALINRVVMQF
jgi:uncharacterized integral membrane protein (TIGR00698 family)